MTAVHDPILVSLPLVYYSVLSSDHIPQRLDGLVPRVVLHYGLHR